MTEFNDPWRDFHCDSPRDAIEIGEWYDGVSRELVIQALHGGDTVEVTRNLKGTEPMELDVLANRTEFLDVTEGDEEYQLWARYHYHGEATPWLRQDGSSAGRVERIRVLSLADERDRRVEKSDLPEISHPDHLVEDPWDSTATVQFKNVFDRNQNIVYYWEDEIEMLALEHDLETDEVLLIPADPEVDDPVFKTDASDPSSHEVIETIQM